VAHVAPHQAKLVTKYQRNKVFGLSSAVVTHRLHALPLRALGGAPAVVHSVDNHSCENQLVQLGQGDDANVNILFLALIRNS
jgi:exopolysaccharide biosynthesis predicted pyruvyltransferase EpsI